MGLLSWEDDDYFMTRLEFPRAGGFGHNQWNWDRQAGVCIALLGVGSLVLEGFERKHLEYWNAWVPSEQSIRILQPQSSRIPRYQNARASDWQVARAPRIPQCQST
ncbi:hypothetical protein AOQ84DRAFT_134164 [Glonium stellatum]|uniref:Uncharacterized protein n=1 Tax=Glonium stellatum TaxID=574774 RepID=A0A8E2JNT7_9PEZI|nr:hypothetical protein AOQ84DRAFT_134164 [Glonium stellatum]